MSDKKIKELYNCENIKIKEDNLVDWYNEVIEKTEAELSIFDVCRALRQNLFTDSALVVMLSFLQHDVFSGDMYEGECIEILSGIDDKILVPYSVTIKEIINKAYNTIPDTEWLCEEDKAEFTDCVDKLKEKVSNTE